MLKNLLGAFIGAKVEQRSGHPLTGAVYGGIQEGGGGPDGLQWVSCNRQSWSASAYLRMILTARVRRSGSRGDVLAPAEQLYRNCGASKDVPVIHILRSELSAHIALVRSYVELRHLLTLLDHLGVHTLLRLSYKILDLTFVIVLLAYRSHNCLRIHQPSRTNNLLDYLIACFTLYFAWCSTSINDLPYSLFKFSIFQRPIVSR